VAQAITLGGLRVPGSFWQSFRYNLAFWFQLFAIGLALLFLCQAQTFGAFLESSNLVVVEAEDFQASTSASGHSWQATSDVAGFVGVSSMRSMPNTGTTASPTYQTLDNSLLTPLSGGDVGDVHNAFGVGGFMNSTKPNGGEDASVAKNFLPDLKPNQIWSPFTNNRVLIKLLVCSVGGPDNTCQPLGAPGLNPWRYICPGTNNPNSYDLWVQLGISGKTNLICNWNQSVQTDSPLP